MLPAVFYRDGDKFWKNANEALCFDPDEGFELISWYAPDDWDLIFLNFSERIAIFGS